MPAKRPYMPLFIDRWRGGTETIAPKHRGPYLDVLCAIWNGNGSLKNDPRVLMSASRLDKRQFASFWAECSGKFLISADVIQHPTVTEMITASDNFAAKMQQNRARQKKKPQHKQRSKKQFGDYHTKGMVSSLREEKPYLPDTIESSPQAASPPSPEGGGGDAHATAEILDFRAPIRAGLAMVQEVKRVRQLPAFEMAPEEINRRREAMKAAIMQGDHHEG